MISTANRSPIWSTTSIAAIDYITIYCQVHIVDCSGSTRQYIWHLGSSVKVGAPGLWIADSNLYYSNWDVDDCIGATPGKWSCTIADDGLNGHHIIGVKFRMSDQRTMDPVIYIDGNLMTLTEVVTPSGQTQHQSDRIAFGGYLYSGSLQPYNSFDKTFQGLIGEIYIHSGLHSAAQMIRLTSRNVKRKCIHLESSSLTHYFPLDEIPDQTQICTVSSTFPYLDINNSGITKTDATYATSVSPLWGVNYASHWIKWEEGDNGVEQKFAIYPLTVSNMTCYGVKIVLKGFNLGTAQVYPKILVAGTWYTLGSTNFTTSVSDITRVYMGTLSQTDINNLQIGLLSGTLSWGNSVQIHTVTPSFLYATNLWDDWVGGLQMIGEDALGYAESSQTYP